VKNYDWKGITELVGIFAVVLSLLLVAFELRQSTAVATAQAVFDVNTVHERSTRSLTRLSKRVMGSQTPCPNVSGVNTARGSAPI
jgi:hypothetical protein